MKLEFGNQQARLLTVDNKENIIDGNLLPAPTPFPSRPMTVPVIPCRLKNDVRLYNI